MNGATIAKGLVLAMLTIPFMTGAKAAAPEPEEEEPEPETDPDLEFPPAIVPAPAGGVYPTVASVPTQQPQPRATPKMFKLRALRRYEVTLDVLPVTGVTLQQLVDQVLPYLRLAHPDFSYNGPRRRASGEPLESEVVQRNGHPVTRVRFRASCLFDHSEPLDRERSLAGVGSIWLESAVDKGEY